MEVALPANASALQDQIFYPSSVSCSSPGYCSAVGYYTDTSGYVQGLLLSEIAGVWHIGVEAALPLGARTNPDAGLDSVSCVPTRHCAAVGWYLTTAYYGGGLALQQ